MNLEQSLGFLLNRTAADMRSALETQLAQHELTAPQWAIMARVNFMPGITMTELARQLGYDKPTTSGIVNRLAVKGILNKKPSTSDLRATELYLSASGVTLFSPLPAIAQRINATAVQGLSDGEVMLLKELLQKIRRNLE
jgi:DNA-binding MarR family transcriptional regulator